MTNPMTNKRNRISLKMDFFQSINDEYTELNYWEALEEAVEDEYNEDAKLKESNGIEKVFDKQAEALSTMGKGVSEEQAEGNRPGEKEIDLDEFVDSSFKGEGEEAMDLAEAPSTVVTSKVMDIVDSIPPRTPEKNRKEYRVKDDR